MIAASLLSPLTPSASNHLQRERVRHEHAVLRIGADSRFSDVSAGSVDAEGGAKL
jgi:hypothetical protein